MEVYSRMAPNLNHIYNFYCYVGNWTAITPPGLLQIKMDLDRDMDTFGPLFSQDIPGKYEHLMLLCFVSKSGWEQDMRIKSSYTLRQENCPDWNDDWIPYFDPNNVVEATKIKESYFDLVGSFKEELVVIQYGDPPATAEFVSEIGG